MAIILKRSPDAYPYVLEIGYHKDFINLITCSPQARSVTINGKPATRLQVEEVLIVIAAQMGDRGVTYTVIEEGVDFAAM